MATTKLAEMRCRSKQAAYPLAPMQEGMLFHTLRAPHAGLEIQQVIADLSESLDVPLFKHAWEKVVSRHDILRTRFCFEPLGQPVQEVHDRVVLPWLEENWTGLDARAQREAFASFLQTDRLRGFNPHEAPLMRLTLLRLDPSSYRLVWTFHHAILDGRSIPLVLREVFGIYERRRDRQPPEKEDVPPSYRDHIGWLQKNSCSHKAKEFWWKQLNGFTSPTPLVVDRHRTLEKTHEGGACEVLLEASVTEKLQALAKSHSLTLNTLVQGAWALLLHRYSGQNDIVFGATRACRHSTVAGADSMVGLLINTVPLRVEVSGQAELLPWLATLRAQWIALREFEHTPLVQIHGWSEVPPDVPLFESIVVFETHELNEAMSSPGGEGAQRKFQLIEQPAFPLMLAAYGGAELRLKLHFDRGRLDEATAARLLGHVRTLLTGMARQPQSRLADLPLLTEKEMHDLVDRNQPRITFGPSGCLHELFEAQAARRPEAHAIVCGHTTLTYAELNRQADQLARMLQQRGVRPETLVAVYLEPSVDLIVALIAVLKAGGAYVPIDVSCPPERLKFLLADSQAKLLLTRRTLVPGALATESEMIFMETADLAGGTAPAADNTREKEVPAPAPNNAAYVIYTSGSSGQPKGVIVTHHNVVRLFQATQPLFRFDESDVWTLFHSPAFDFSVWEMWGALIHGGKLIIIPPSVSRAPETFYELLARERVTVLNQTPSALRQLIRVDEKPAAATALALRWIILGGEALDPRCLAPWFDRHGDDTPQVINMYGITETTVHVTFRRITKEDLSRGSVIGIPLPDLQISILDPNGKPLPVGVPGEMYVGGAGLARGYLHQPTLTAERFIPHPFRQETGQRLYRTGDRGRFINGRDIEYLGRVDDQIKIRGFRIEPGEIESVLAQHPGLREVVVMAREDKPGDQRLVAYLVGPGSVPSAGELRNFLKTRLPEFMLPSAYVALERMPMTRNGKIDRAALPTPPSERPDVGPAFVAPSTQLEKTIADIWQDLLGVKKVGLHDNFFEMGGHSLLLVQLHHRLQMVLGRSVAITTLFQYPTVSALTDHLKASPRPAAETSPGSMRAQRMRELEETGV